MPDCSACKAMPQHKPKRGTCALGHPFAPVKQRPFARRTDGICHHKCFTQAQLTQYIIEIGKNVDYIPRKPRKMRGTH